MGREGRDPSCAEVPESEEWSLVLVNSKELKGSSDSDSDTNSLVELTGGMVSWQDRPRDRGMRMPYLKGRRCREMFSVTSGHRRQSRGIGRSGDFYFRRYVVEREE